MPTHPPQPDPFTGRVQRVEEALGFTDHAVSQANAEILALNKRLDALSRRIDTLERRLEQATAVDEPGLAGGSLTDDQLRQNKPPHSA